MTEHDALLAAVLAAPADDLPRLVLADHLDEHGSPARAEFIRVQVEMARLAPHCETSLACSGCSCTDCRRYDGLRKRESELMRAGVKWWGDYCGESGLIIPGDGWHRGFIREIMIPAAAWTKHGDAILALQPVRKVKLVTRLDLRSSPRLWDGCYRLPGDRLDRRFEPTAAHERGLLADPDALFSRRLRLGLLHLRWPSVATFDLPAADTVDRLPAPRRRTR